MRRCGSVLRTVSAILRLLCVCVAALASRLQVATSASTTFLQAHAHGCAFFVCKWPLLLAQGWSYVYTRANPFVFVFFSFAQALSRSQRRWSASFFPPPQASPKVSSKTHDTLRFRGFLSIKAIDRERSRSLRLAASGGG